MFIARILGEGGRRLSDRLPAADPGMEGQ